MSPSLMTTDAMLTSLGDHATHPRAQVVHLADAMFQLARMMRSVRFPLPAFGTPLWPAVGLADKDLLAVKGLEAGAVQVRVGRHPRVRL